MSLVASPSTGVEFPPPAHVTNRTFTSAACHGAPASRACAADRPRRFSSRLLDDDLRADPWALTVAAGRRAFRISVRLRCTVPRCALPLTVRRLGVVVALIQRWNPL